VRCPSCGAENLPGADECARCLESLMQEDVPRPGRGVERSIMVDTLATLHSPKPEMVPPETSLAAVVSHMRETNIGYVLVVDDAGKLTGILTERDLLFKVAGQVTDLASAPVKEWMTPNPTALAPTEPIKHALFLMAHNGFRHVPLVDEAGRPQAIVTVRHFVEYIERLSPETASE
jgi:CBS domain-containing protein